MNIRCLPLLAAALCLSSCIIETATGPVRHDSRSIERDASERVRVDLSMGAGNLIIGGGARQLLNADFTYNVPSWRPEVRYTSTSTHGDLTIRQPGQGHAQIGHMKYDWDLALNNDVRIRGGIGEATVRLPAGVGVYAEGAGGIGEIKTQGLRREGDHWINDAYDDSKVRIHLDVHGGIGSIRLLAD